MIRGGREEVKALGQTIQNVNFIISTALLYIYNSSYSDFGLRSTGFLFVNVNFIQTGEIFNHPVHNLVNC